MLEQLVSLSKTFEKRGYQVEICENSERAIEVVCKIIGESKSPGSIGFGNSLTLKNMKLKERLSEFTQEIYVHAPIGTEESDRKALTADFYLTSANAISQDGHIVNIDGTGNRTAATCFGPKHVIYIIGKNKVANTLEEAIIRAKEVAVELARRFGRKTPCVISGKCENCISPECICSITTIHRKKPYGIKGTLILIDEEVGL